MASLITRNNGTRELQVVLDKQRKVIRLGKVSKTAAEAAKRHVEQLVDQYIVGHPADRYARQWLTDISDTLHDRVAKTGLTSPRVSAQLGPFIERFIKDRGPEFKPATVIAWEAGKKSMVEHFGESCDIRSITEGDAQAYRAKLISNGLAEATVRRRCGHAKNMLGYAVRLRLIDTNPFGNKAVPTASPRSKTKAFIDDAISRRILDHLPDSRWRLIWSLARWGGVRVPSEVAALRWDGVDQAGGRLTVHSPKTERHEGHEARQIPLFPEIESALVDWYEVSYDGDELVFPGAATNGAAYRDTLIRAIKKAGRKPWPKLWTAVRATRAEELERPMEDGRCLPEKVVNAWMGNSSGVRRAHYTTSDRRLIDQAFDVVLGAEESAAPNGTKPTQTASKNPVSGHRRLETGSESWPTGTVGQHAMALLFLRLCEDGRMGAAKGAAPENPDLMAAFERLDDDLKHHMAAVAKLLADAKAHK